MQIRRGNHGAFAAGRGKSTAASVTYLLGLIATQPAAAYSTRRLSSTYSGSLAKISKSTDTTGVDIGAGAVITSAEVGSYLSGVDGFIATLYDQSGNGRHMDQTTFGLRPKIATAGALETLGGAPCLAQNASSYLIAANGMGITSTSGYTLICVTKTPSSARGIVIKAGASGNGVGLGVGGGGSMDVLGQEVLVLHEAVAFLSTGLTNLGNKVMVARSNGSAVAGNKAWLNTTTASVSTNSYFNSATSAYLGGYPAAANRYFTGSYAEVLVYNAILSDADVATLIANQISYFSIT